MSQQDALRQAVIRSLFPQQGPDTEHLLIVLKVFEDVKPSGSDEASQQGQKKATNIVGKPRYLCLTRKHAKARIHKAKKNSNSSFSIGKTWALEEIKLVENIDFNQFTVTLNKPYTWAVEQPRDKMMFLAHIVDQFQQAGKKPPKLVNVDMNRLMRCIIGAQDQSSLPTSASPTVPNFPPDARAPYDQKPSGSDYDQLPARYREQPPSQEIPQAKPLAPYGSRPGPPPEVSSYPSPSHHSGPPQPQQLRQQVQQPPPRPPPHMHQPSPSPMQRPSQQQPPARPSPPVGASSQQLQGPPPQKSVLAAYPAESRAPPPAPVTDPRASPKDMAPIPPKHVEDRSSMRQPSDKTVSSPSEDGRRPQNHLPQLQANVAAVGATLNGTAASPAGSPKVHKPVRSATLGQVPKGPPSPITTKEAAAKRLSQPLPSSPKPKADDLASPSFLLTNHVDSKQEQARRAEIRRQLEEQTSQINVDELLAGFDWKGSGNADALEKKLLSEAAALEAANVHAVLQIDDRVLSVISGIDDALRELEHIDDWLSLYSAELNSIGDDTHHIETQNRGLQIQTTNQKALIKELDALLNVVSVPQSAIETLKNESLETIQGLARVEAAAGQLLKVLHNKHDEDMQNMRIVQERQQLYNSHANNFNVRISEYLKVIVQFQADSLMSDKNRAQPANQTPKSLKGYKILPHDPCEDALIKYRGICVWLKEMDPRRMTELQMVYAQAMSKTYQKDFKEILEIVRARYLSSGKKGVEELDYVFKPEEQSYMPRNMLGYSPSIRAGPEAVKRYGSRLRRGDDTTSKPVDDGDDNSFADALAQIVPLMVREQNYMTDLFSLSSTAPQSFEDRPPLQESVSNKASLYEKKEVLKDMKTQKRVLELMEVLFAGTGDGIAAVVDVGIRNDPTQALSMVVGLEIQIEPCINSDQIFVLNLLRASERRLISLIQKFLDDQLKIIEETRITFKRRSGILSFIKTFPIPILEPWVKYAKNAYDYHLYQYVKEVMRRPLGRLLEFFEGVESTLSTTAPEEVSFHINYNKAQVRKVIAQYPSKEIRKSLELLYRRVNKHFSEEEGLLQVVWRGIQEELLVQHKKMESLITTCYPGAELHLEFTTQDLLKMMTELSKKVNS
ncbi:hypothetical protein BZG36_02547 [Bifiguratus adelaidae]|uniref:Exocyst complex component Sec3 PIP2-binding N-terminal domain-containing protein n=1 Tax=Bifiguratus adelaidae TaxID=1938954 RepID=A0A261Y267_9FUNG|nr:hypothetical protein BZG36_02547 [Bifiguratus adelaidae]